MNKEQRQTAFNFAKTWADKYAPIKIELDADVLGDQGFDEVSDGVWVHAWIKVPKEAIPDYEMTPPAPAATVLTVHVPRGAWPFPSSHTHLNTNNQD